jgi:hypothetical protein
VVWEDRICIISQFLAALTLVGPSLLVHGQVMTSWSDPYLIKVVC